MEMNKVKPVKILIVERNPENLKQLIEAFKYSKLPNNIRFAGGANSALKIIFQSDEYRDLGKPDIIISDLTTYRKEVRWGILEEIAKRESIKCIPTVILSSLEEIENLEIQNCPNLLLPKPKTFKEYQNVVESIEKFWFSVHKGK
jgi:CheY-like chemotaxis protein